MSCQESGGLAQWCWSFAKVVQTPCPPGELGGRVGDNGSLLVAVGLMLSEHPFGAGLWVVRVLYLEKKQKAAHSQSVAEQINRNTKMTFRSPSVCFRVNICWCEFLIRHLTRLQCSEPNLRCPCCISERVQTFSEGRDYFCMFVKCTAGP